MSPPPTSIDGTDITGATIDGQEVQEITVDGQTVFRPFTPPQSLVSRWTFDEGSGSTAFDSVDNNDGTINGPTFTTDAELGSHALSFDGTDDFVEVANNTNLETPEVSFGCWFKTTTEKISMLVVKDGPRFDASYLLRTRINPAALELLIATGGNGFVQVFHEANIYSGNYLHVFGTLGPTNGTTLYLEGSAVASNTNSAITYDGSPFFIGKRRNNSQFMDGSIDDCRVYNKELSAVEVSNLYNTGSI